MKKKILFTLLSGACFCCANAQNASLTKVWEYCPAPGQFVHELPLYEQGDSPEKMAEKCLNNLQHNVPVSLGGFGGYITVGFDHTILNVLGQKDFIVLGNAFEGSAEPGIVTVSYDANHDGIPNDQWYELAGSEYTNPATILGYEITYTRPKKSDADVLWVDNQGRNGIIKYMGTENIYHTHSHYPEWIFENTLTFTGNCIPDNAYWDKVKKMWVMKAYPYGYTDNYPNENSENCSFDIDWAIDDKGIPIALKGIDFIRIYTGVNQQIPSGGVGELSTEITGLQDLHPMAANISIYSSSKENSTYYRNGKLFMDNQQEENVSIYDLKGDLISRFRMNNPKEGHSVYLPNGIYIIKSSKGISKLKI